MAKSSQLRLSILTLLLIWFLVLCAACFVMLGELAWLLFLLWLPFFVWSRWYRRAAIIVGGLCVVIITAHFSGHQVIGRPQVVVNRPFESDVCITVLGPGTKVTLSDGRSFRLAGLKEKISTDGQGVLGPSWGIAGRDKKRRRRAVNYDNVGVHEDVRWSILDERLDFWEPEDGIPVQIKDEGNGSAQITVGLRRVLIRCGNSFFPTFFPRNIPRFEKSDLGMLLIWTGAVVPDETAKDVTYKVQINAAYENNQAARDRASKEAKERAKKPAIK